MYIADSEILITELPSKITDNIFQGSYICAEYKSNLKDLGVTHILVAGILLEKHFPNSFKYLQIEMLDDENEDVFKYFNDIYDYIDSCIESKGKILIHCMAGLSRSTTCVLVYLIKKNKLTYKEGLEFIKKSRKNVCPNKGYEEQLIKWEGINLNDNNKKIIEIDSNIEIKEKLNNNVN